MLGSAQPCFMLCKSVVFPEHRSEGMPDQQHGAAPVVHQVLEPEPKEKERYCTTSSNTACMSAVWRGWPHLDLREYMSWSVRWWVTLKRQPPSWCRGQRSPHVQSPEASPSSSLQQDTSYYMTSKS